jgi:hypothetical protein
MPNVAGYTTGPRTQSRSTATSLLWHGNLDVQEGSTCQTNLSDANAFLWLWRPAKLHISLLQTVSRVGIRVLPHTPPQQRLYCQPADTHGASQSTHPHVNRQRREERWRPTKLLRDRTINPVPADSQGPLPNKSNVLL